MSTPVADLLQWLSHYRYLLLFPLVAIEGPIVTVIAGFLASLGQMEFIIALIIVITGDLAGDTIYYLLGKWGGRPWMKRWGHYIGLNEHRIAKLETHFKKHPAKTLLLGKLAHGFGGPVLAAAGLADLPYLSFFLFNLAPTVPKSLLLFLLGFYFGIVNNYFNSVIIILFSFSVLLCLLFFMIPRIFDKYMLKNKSNYANTDSK